MSDLSVSSAVGSTQQSQQSQWSQTKSLFEELGKALQSGDMAGAQQVYTALQQNAPQGALSQVRQGSSGPSPFAALGQALQSGNLAGAQQAYAQIQQARASQQSPQFNSNPAAAPEVTPASALPGINLQSPVNLTA